jgi:hypothetical protein
MHQKSSILLILNSGDPSTFAHLNREGRKLIYHFEIQEKLMDQ